MKFIKWVVLFAVFYSFSCFALTPDMMDLLTGIAVNGFLAVIWLVGMLLIMPYVLFPKKDPKIARREMIKNICLNLGLKKRV